MSELDALLAGLRDRADALAKAQGAPEVKVGEPAVAAATETPATTEEPAAAAAPAATETTEAAPAAATAAAATEEAGATTAKAMEVTLEDGSKAPAIDGFALLKAMGERIEELAAEVTTLKSVQPVQGEAVEIEGFDFDGLQKSFDERTETMAKALASAMDALAASHAQVGELTQKVAVQAEQLAQHDTTMKAIDQKVTAFGNTGRGRTSTVSVHEKPSAAAVATPEQTVGDLFAKANTLIAAGKLSAIDAGRVNSWVNAGKGVPPEYAALFASA